MTYSCGLFEDGRESLVEAQQKKLDLHIEWSRADRANRVLDIGCGWGSAMRRLAERNPGATVTGLTLSEAQSHFISRDLGADVRIESWSVHQVDEPYDAVLSIGAFEHFAHPDYGVDRKIEVYRAFFQRCHDVLCDGGYMSLQTIGFGLGRFIPHTPLAKVFPESQLPRLSELAAACDGLFEVEEVRQDRTHYVRTLEEWRSLLSHRRLDASRLVGSETVDRYLDYLDFTRRGMAAGIFVLYRIRLRRVVLPHRK